jgi:aromatic-L-amino-acid decarboxylase
MHAPIDYDCTIERADSVEKGDRQHAILDAAEFGRLARRVLARLEETLAAVDTKPLTLGCVPERVVAALRAAPVPVRPTDPQSVVDEALSLMLNNSLFTAHPRFLGYVCPAADPIGILADTIVSAINPNAASVMMAPIGHEIERTVIRWLAQILGLPSEADGVLVSGGNEANLIGILSAREYQTPWPIRTAGFNHPDAAPLRVYATTEVHNGVQKAVEIAGLGSDALRMISVDKERRMNVGALNKAIEADRKAGAIPICIVATVGTVATGAVDPLVAIMALAVRERLWVHIDGCYGAAATLLPNASEDIRAISSADSVTWDPHKWLRVPYEAACILLRRPNSLSRVFGVRPSYYYSGRSGEVVNYYEKCPQNSRSLRALKVWMSLTQHGTAGHAELIARDIDLAHRLFSTLRNTSAFEAWAVGLSVVTFRYIPTALRRTPLFERERLLLNEINRQVLARVQDGGDAYLTNAVIDDHFLLRACFVNYNTRASDVDRLVALVERVGMEIENVS